MLFQWIGCHLVSVILPDLDYCCPLFACGLRSTHLLKLGDLERRAVRVCAGADHSAPCEPLYNILKISPLKQRWLLKILTLTFQAVRAMRPPAVNNLLDHHEHRYNTRGQSSSALVPRRATHLVARRSFSFRAVLIWNSLSSFIRDVYLMSEFKRQILSLFVVEVERLINLAFSVL